MGRVMIAADRSGSGKTMLTCGLISIFRGREMAVSSLKCGPDYIDPMFHRSVLGIRSENIDPFFSDGKEMEEIVSASEEEILIIEGVMGIYDGITGQGCTGSCYEVARKTGTPIILVIDAAGMGNTVLSLVKGICADDEDGWIRGVIFNRMSGHFLNSLRPQFEEIFGNRGPILLGALPRLKDAEVPSRHLGLVLPDEVDALHDRIDHYRHAIEENIDLDAVTRIAGESRIAAPGWREERRQGRRQIRLAVAGDEAFCFYYERNLREFLRRGVELVYFSPIHDKQLPDRISGLLLGGGYPELFARELSGNVSMREAVAGAIKGGMPSLAECGGFMYLMEGITTADDGCSCSCSCRYEMAGVVPGWAENAGRAVRLGYREITGEGGLLGGLTIRGHEFHHYDTPKPGADCVARRPGNNEAYRCMFSGEEHLWGFAHLYYPSCSELIDRFVERMEAYCDERIFASVF